MEKSNAKFLFLEVIHDPLLSSVTSCFTSLGLQGVLIFNSKKLASLSCPLKCSLSESISFIVTTAMIIL